MRTADCDWGFPLPDTSEQRMEKCYAQFREHCIERHGLRETDTNAQMFLNLGKALRAQSRHEHPVFFSVVRQARSQTRR